MTSIEKAKKTQTDFLAKLGEIETRQKLLAAERRCQVQQAPRQGHKQTSRDVRVTSALPPIADIRQRIEHVCFVPIADISIG
jgi:hypothetical protein